MLIKNKQSLNVEKDDVQASIPASSFDNNDEPVQINVNEIKSDPNSLSSTYDFTIQQGTRTISQFDEGITLTFNVNAARAKNPNNLKVFYFNEETEKWENVGGTYQNGKVTVVTYHFSMFTVFEAADENAESDEIVDVNDDLDEEEENSIDLEEVMKSFPEEKGFAVSEDGKTITLETALEQIELTTEQVKMLLDNNQTLILVKEDVQVSIPASSFDNYDESVEIGVNELERVPNSYSNTYDFTITQGIQTISQFEDGITLTFNVDAKNAKNPDHLKVFYLNEETGKRENIGGTYDNGEVTVVTNHFSTFAVFEAAGENGESDEIVVVDDEEKNSGTILKSQDPVKLTSSHLVAEDDAGKESDEGTTEVDNDQSDAAANEDKLNEKEGQKESKGSNKLPKTATNYFTMLLVGLLLISTGLVYYFISRRKAYSN